MFGALGQQRGTSLRTSLCPHPAFFPHYGQSLSFYLLIPPIACGPVPMALNTLGHRAQRPRAKSWSVFAITRVSGHPHDWPRALFAHQQYCLALRSQRVYYCSLPKSAPKTLGHWRSRHHRRRATFLQQRWQSHSNTPGKPGSSRTPFKPGKQDILDRLSGVLSLRNNNIRDQLTCIPFSRASSLLFPPTRSP